MTKLLRPHALEKQVVALYFYSLGQAGGGAERIICSLASALSERKFQVHLITWDADDAQIFYPIASGVVWHRLGFPEGLRGKLERTVSLMNCLNMIRAKALIGFVMSGDKTVYAATYLAKVKLIVAERNAPTLYHFRYSRLQRWLIFACLHLADRITVQIPEFIEGYPSSLASRMLVIPNPIESAPLYAEPASPNSCHRYTLLCVSRYDLLQKQLDCLLNAFARLPATCSEWDLTLVGDGQDKRLLEQLIEDFGLTDRVTLQSTQKNISTVYQQAHLFVLPSRWEGFPNALAEAMAHGLPAVGFRDAAGVAQLIDDGETGWLAPGLEEPSSLAQTLAIAMSSPVERERRGKQAIESMKQYDPGTQFDRWAELLRSQLKPV